MRSSIVLVIVVLFLIAGLVYAQLFEEHQEYFDGPEGFLLTNEEAKEWKKIKTNEAAERFIQLFWARRDPDLETRINEFRLEFERRVEYADKSWGFADVRGAISDRGMVLILLGPAAERFSLPSGRESGESRRAERGRIRGVFSYTERPAMERWGYQMQDLPRQTKELKFEVYFIQTEAGQDAYVLDRSASINMRALSLMADAPDWYVVNPELTEIPEYPEERVVEQVAAAARGVIPGSPAASAEQLAWLAAEPVPWIKGSEVVSTEGLMSGPSRFIWVHMLLPAGSPRAELAIGRLRHAGQADDLGSFAVAVIPVDLMHGHAYELSVPIAAGTWQLELALVGQQGALAVTTVELEAAATDPSATLFSPMYWGAESAQKSEMPFGDPFNLGGWVVHPRIGDTYQMNEELIYGCFVLGPKLNEHGRHEVQASMTLVAGEQRVPLVPPQPAPLTKLGEDLWMYAGALPLQGFSQTGDYLIEIELSQPADSSRTLARIPLTLVASE